MNSITYEKMDNYSDSRIESDGFCSVSSACSGPSPSNLVCDYDPTELSPNIHYRGGNYGSCHFLIRNRTASNSCEVMCHE